MTRILSILLLLPGSVYGYIGGIPVPGRSVPVLRLFENYAHSCTPSSRKNFGFEQISDILNSLNAEEVALKVYNSLFFSIAQVDVEKLMGKWFTVVDSPTIHKERCTVSFFDLLSQTPYTVKFSVVQYSRNGDEIVSSEGFGSALGPDPGELLIHTGNEVDPCPYFPVSVGPLDVEGRYSFVVLSQPLKHPSMVLARNPFEFETKYSSDVRGFLEKHGFLAPLASFNRPLQFVNASSCQNSDNFYNEVSN